MISHIRKLKGFRIILMVSWIAAISAVFFVASSLAMAQEANIDAKLAGKNAHERAEQKAEEIARSNIIGTYNDKGVEVEIQSVKKIPGGVELYARAWKNGKQLGFGKDGSVEIERFRIYNPPVLVDDENGSIVHEWTDRDGNKKIRNLKEDPIAAVHEVLSHAVTVAGKQGATIVKGSIGKTTSIFYPDADSESTSVDGRTKKAGTNLSWGSLLSATPADNVSDTANIAEVAELYAGAPTDTFQELIRSFFLFDTSEIDDSATIYSGTLSVYGYSKDDNFSLAVALSSSSPSSNTSLQVSDHDKVGYTRFSSDISISSWSITDYNDFTLNEDGLANIDTSGVSKFGMRLDRDLDNNAPTWSSNTTGQALGYFADETGTSKDPMLIIQHVTVVAEQTPVGGSVRKSSTETTVSDTALSGDSELEIGLSTSTSYLVHGVIFASSTSQVPDIKIAFSVPSGSQMDIGVVASSVGIAELLQTSGAASDAISLQANIPTVIQIEGTIQTGSSNGILSLSWAQNVSDSATVGVLRGSYLQVEPI